MAHKERGASTPKELFLPGFAETFERVGQYAEPHDSYMWTMEHKTMTRSHIDKWFRTGDFNELAFLLKHDPSALIHPVINLEMKHLAGLIRKTTVEEMKKDPDAPYEQEDIVSSNVRVAAEKALQTMFTGLWEAFAPRWQLKFSPKTRRGTKKGYRPFFVHEVTCDVKDLKEEFERLRDENPICAERKKGESLEQFRVRLVELVQQLHLSTKYAFGVVAGKWTWQQRLDPPVALQIATQAVRSRLDQTKLICGLVAFHHLGNPAYWKRIEGIHYRHS